MTGNLQIEHLPTLFSVKPGEPLVQTVLNFSPLNTDGRIGAEIHSLYSTMQTGADGAAAAIVRYSPGAKAVAHRHKSYELIYIIDGELETDEGVFPQNSLLIMHPNSVHAPRSRNGCLVLVVWEKAVERV